MHCSLDRLQHGTARRSLAVVLTALAVFGLGACSAQKPPASAPSTEYYPVPGRSDLPFSEAVRAGSTLYLAGQLGTDERGVVSGGIEAETRQALENIRKVLEQHGSSLDRVVKCTAILADMKEWSAMNGVYVRYFPRHLPARTAFGATALALGGRVELECIATVDPR